MPYRGSMSAEQYLELILEESPIPMSLKAATGEYLLVNHAFLARLDGPASGVLGHTDDDLYSAGTADRIRALDAEAYRAETPVSGEIRLVVGDTERWYSRFALPVWLDSEREAPDAIFSIATDINEWKRREAVIEDVASVLSHDVRNVLTIATGRLQLARETTENPHLDPVEAALTRLQSLVENTVMLVRETMVVPDPEPVALANVARSAWGDVGTDPAAVHIEASAEVRADPGQCRRLLAELFRNAVDHGGSDVSVRVGLLDTGFFVEDNGPGIPDDAYGDVRTVGYSDPRGNGLGLAIVDEIARKHGWRMEIMGAGDGGTRFEFHDVDVCDG